MNVKKTLENVGYLDFKMFITMDTFRLGGYTQKLMDEYYELSKQKRELLIKLVESTITLKNSKNSITLQKKVSPEGSEFVKMLDTFEEEYNTPTNYPLPKSVKEQLRRLL